ncbi:hypothetical protein K491DRAFT_590087 [Lophiostoma macrostomum CBS 122681]|uniref:Formin GTPase-binding domain-containing protein n=1 Tax=Lophiostoma macrostomum CBS 122681 TaxID=1314788 RepID=A0A6A6TM13_9PLEO|nr:hypothetical protein K491DRAFT_590087 [Lophiostoma macrostomum CBS 122681]
MAPPEAAGNRRGHARNKSASMLKSIIVPKNHKRAPSDGTPLNKEQPDSRPHNPATNAGPMPMQMPLLPPDHPHSQLRSAARSHHIPTNPPSPRKPLPQDPKASPSKGLHKKTLSSVSLRSLGKDKEKEKAKEDSSERRARDKSRTGEDSSMAKPKKTKSSTNLGAVFGKSKQPKESKVALTKDKENTTPPSSANASGPVHTPIWAQFSSQALQEITTTSKVPLNDRRSIEEEIRLYTPQDYSPSKQRNFFDYGQPSLQKRPVVKERPKSYILPHSNSGTSFIETLTRKRSNERAPLSDTKGNEGRPKDNASAQGVSTRGMLRRSSSDSAKRKEEPVKHAASPVKKPNRVMAAVAAFNGKAKEGQVTATPTAKLDPQTVEAEFEDVLESRNIPQHQRAAMRTLKLDVKADFVRTHKLDTPTISRATSAQSAIAKAAGNKSAKPTLGRGLRSQDSPDEEAKDRNEKDTNGGSSKRERPRSRTFTFSKGDSPVKKYKADRPGNDRKISSKSTPIPKSPSSRSLVSNGSTRSNNGSKTSTPEDFITYMRTVTKPEDVEVGRLHKLRQLLRNETVEWVDVFIQDGGLTELVSLLYRIMEVEWREDHEDQLLHEVLRCLKGLCTTDSALRQFADIAPTLFPKLLGMLFDEEHKGPSEFTTRELVIQIIYAHISMAPEGALTSRAVELMKYLKDPVKEKESSTVPFVLQMHQPRPYTVWCKEITNVTKEVFWIFIHQLQVVPKPVDSNEPPKTYVKSHFPGQRAIVPAQPYVGGVEWDATNYLTTHLDLLNGIIASLPTREARNTMRNELRVSGFEKIIGHLRTCSVKYYGAVHDALKVWVAAALEDGWDVKTVRMGASDGKTPSSPVKSSPKKTTPAPKLEAPKVDMGLGLGLDLKFEKEIAIEKSTKVDDDWI